MRIRLFLILCALALCCAPAFAQSSSGTGFWACPTSVAGQSLHVYNWTTYIAEDTISNFERLCSVTVTYDTYASDDDMIAELEKGNPGYDVVVPTDVNVATMISENLLQPLNMKLIPDFANVDPKFANPSYDPGNVYTVPYQWGTIGVGYNKTKIPNGIKSWNDVFNYNGPVAWIDYPRQMYGIVLNLLGDDPNTADTKLIDQASQFLLAHKANVYAIAPDTGQDMLAAKQADIVIEYNGDILQVINSCQCNDFAYTIPQEGSVIWTDNMAIPAGAPNPTLANIFIDYVLNAQVGADISNYTAYATPNAASINNGLIETQYADNPAIYPSADIRAKLFPNKADPNLDKLYSDAWSKVKAAVGK